MGLLLLTIKCSWFVWKSHERFTQ